MSLAVSQTGPALRIEAAIGREYDNFGLARLILSLMVVVSHTVSIGKTGLAADEIGRASTGFTLGEHAVNGFFAISGFLICMSWERRPDAFVFLTSRFLRLVPALVGAVVFATLVLGPLMTSLSFGAYFRDRETWSFLWETILRLKSTGALPGVFRDNPLDIVIGTVWSLKYEIGCYLGLFVLGITGLLLRRWVVLGVVLFFGLGLLAIDIFQIEISPSRFTGFRLRFIFALGAALYVWRASIALTGWVAGGLLALTVLLAKTPFYQTVLFASEGYVVLYLALAPNLTLRALDMPFDLSYGVYLYGMMVQQMLVSLFHPQNPYWLLPPALLLTVLLATLSWAMIEHPALRLKSKVIGRFARRPPASASLQN